MSEANPVLARMSAHRSVRSFAPTPVPDEHIEAAVAAAQMASTSSWVQAYCLIQVTDPDERARLAELTGGQKQVAQAGAFFALCADTRRHRMIAEREGAPYVGNLETFLLATVDATLFAQNLALAFESMDYGICMIGGLRTRLPEASELLAIPHGVWPLFGLCVGKPAEDPGQRPRLPVNAIWMKDRYADDERVFASMDAHDEVAARYYVNRESPGRNWTGGTWRKFKAPLREHLLGYYTSMGARFE
ncbi:MAG: NADPH-dependent oxidoreductase [bacterium]|nr:NADPH-dependent oxidoreductase [bacterium]